MPSDRLVPIAFLLLAVIGCGEPPSPAPTPIRVDTVDPDLWYALVSANPLPQAFDPSRDAGSAPDPAISIVRVTEPQLRSTRSPLEPQEGPAIRVLDRRWLAPAVPLWYSMPPTGAKPRSAAAGLLPLDEIGIPLTAVAVHGRYPGDDDYPYVEQLVLEFRPSATGLEPESARLAELWDWFLSVPASNAAPPLIGWIGGVGDLMVAQGVTELLDRSDGLHEVFGSVLPIMQSVDFLMGNLEGAVTTRGTPWEKTFLFRFHPRVLSHLHRAGFDYLSVVNNHSYDYGEVGFLDTIAHLDASPIVTSGAGRSLEDARRPYQTDLPGGTRLSILSVGAYPLERSGFDGARETPAGPDRPGVLWAGPRNRQAQRDAFEAMRDGFGSDTFNVVMVHGGPEWATEPSRDQRELYRSFIDAGADLVLGHHSHVVQGLETYRGGLIAHSLGNYVFPGMYLTEYGEQSMVLRIGVVAGRIRYVEPIPVRIDHQRLSLDTDDQLRERFSSATRVLHGE